VSRSQNFEGLKEKSPRSIAIFKVDTLEREYRIWQRDSLAVLMGSRAKVGQKIGYIHRNPLHERWNLADCPESYPWSSANFYETGGDKFGFLTHY